MSKVNKSPSFRDKVRAREGWALTFSDVILVPGHTRFSPQDVDITTKLGPFKFSTPIFSAAMDTVTETEMAIQMALLGGLGVIHRNCSYEYQLEMVTKVKRARSFVIDDVATIGPDQTIRDAIAEMDAHGISGLVVVDDEGTVLGIVTKRDLPFDETAKGLVKDIMTPSPVCEREGISREGALRKLYEIRKEKLPIVDDKGKLVGLITKKDLKPEFPNAATDDRGRLVCGLGISPFFPKNKVDQDLLKKIDEYVDVFFLDVAEYFKDEDMAGTKRLMEELSSYFVVGNVGTFEAAEYILTQADFPDDQLVGIKVGMGSGSICTTTLQTGVGAPTLMATAEVADAIAQYNPKVALVADGGFVHPGDLPKAFAVGADAVMSGHFFAGCTESPGLLDTIGGRKVKVYRGMGSEEARRTGPWALDRYVKAPERIAEGVSDHVPFVGPVRGVLAQLTEGLRAAMVYTGSRTLRELRSAQLRHVTFAGKIEAGPHDLLGR
ncbi:MAG: IMP dehydrogenase [Promethearchaeota archaeon]